MCVSVSVCIGLVVKGGEREGGGMIWTLMRGYMNQDLRERERDGGEREREREMEGREREREGRERENNLSTSILHCFITQARAEVGTERKGGTPRPAS